MARYNYLRPLNAPVYELSWNNREEVLRLPVNPQDVPEIYRPGNNKNWNTTDVGPFKAIGEPGLATMTIASFFPSKVYPFCTYLDFPRPKECVAMLQRWQRSKRPIRVIIEDYVNGAFAIEGLTIKREIGTNDIFFQLELEQYRFATESNQTTGNLFRDPPLYGKDEIATYWYHKLTKGETWCNMAEQYYKDSSRWKAIYENNKKYGLKDQGHIWDCIDGNVVEIPLWPTDHFIISGAINTADKSKQAEYKRHLELLLASLAVNNAWKQGVS